jgi:hypothetical protein
VQNYTSGFRYDARELEEEQENNSVELINDIGGINE